MDCLGLGSFVEKKKIKKERKMNRPLLELLALLQPQLKTLSAAVEKFELSVAPDVGIGVGFSFSVANLALCAFFS